MDQKLNELLLTASLTHTQKSSEGGNGAGHSGPAAYWPILLKLCDRHKLVAIDVFRLREQSALVAVAANNKGAMMSYRPLVSIVRILMFSPLLLASLSLARPALAAPAKGGDSLTPEETYAAINSGWYDSLESLGKQLRPDRNYIIINLVEPDHAMDMRSAELFRRSFIAPGGERGFTKPEIGHTLLAWQCRDYVGRMHRGVTGLTGENNQQSLHMFRSGWGLSALASTFTDGALQDARDASDEFAIARKSGNRVWGAIFEVDDSQCGGLYRYLNDFIFHPNQPVKKFGLMPDPAKFEGGGCGSFGTALVQHAHVLPDETLALFRRTLTAPSSLFGWGLKLPEDTIPFLPGIATEASRPRKISLLKLVNESWEGSGAKESLSLIDPELFIFALRTLHRLHFESLRDAKAIRASYLARYPAERIVTSIHSLAQERRSTPILPEDPLWITERYPIDTNFDEHTKAIEMGLRSWWQSRVSAGFRSDMIFDGRLAYVILHRTEETEPMRPSVSTAAIGAARY